MFSHVGKCIGSHGLAEADGEDAYVAQTGSRGPCYDYDLSGRLAREDICRHAAQRYVRDVAAVAQVRADDDHRIAACPRSAGRAYARQFNDRWTPLGDIVCRHPAGVREEAARIQIDPVVRQRGNIGVHAAAEIRPASRTRGIPHRHAIRRHSAGARKEPPGIQIHPIMSQGQHSGHSTTHPAAEIRPASRAGRIPRRHAIRRYVAGRREPAAHIQVGRIMRQGIRLAIQAIAQTRPTGAVP